MFDFLLDRDIVGIILSAEVVFCAVFTLSLFIAVHSVLRFVRQSGSLYTRLAQIESELSVLHASIPGKLERIGALRQELAPLQDELRRIQIYYARLQNLDRKWLQDEAARLRAQEEQEEKRIQRHKLGLDRFL